MVRKTAILFDWDGTLLDSFEAGVQASMAVFHHFGIDTDRARFLLNYSPNWYETYHALGLPREQWPAADALWLDTYYQRPSELFPFAQGTLETLGRAGYKLGLVTSGTRDRVQGELTRHKVRSLFSTAVFYEDTKEQKPHPIPLLTALDRMGLDGIECIYAGDTPEDMEMGRQAGVFTVGVKSAYATQEALAKPSPDLLLPHVGHLPSHLGLGPEQLCE